MYDHRQRIRLAAVLLALPLLAGLGARLVQAGVPALLAPPVAGAGALVSVLTGGAAVVAGAGLLWLALLAVGIWFLVRGRRFRQPSDMDRARGILAERFARGEITGEEYRERLEQLR